MTLVALPGVVVLGMLLAYILLNQILKPIKILSLEEGGVEINNPLPREMTALRQRVHSLMENVDQTQSELQQSREHLLQAEKLAMVGKLAAGVAHTIRNPLTSVNMRLFSLERSLKLSQTQQEDFEVISEEVRHIDTIVQNFLEFARPPKLKIQSISPSEVVDMALQLLRHRLESYGVQVELDRQYRLPKIEADPEQLKEVLINLLVNACEAMGEGGLIVIREEEGVAEPLGRVVVIRVKDNGPGMPKSVRDKVFQPFFSTKEEGTGLGLSIAYRIVEEHGGWLSLKSKEGEGTTFTITLPCREDAGWARS
jgi:signal transduction histidine kinase